jgi:glutamine amidotransferase
MACSGDPILAEEQLFKPQHSIIDQSMHSRLGATTTNGRFGRTDDPFEAV